MANAGKSSVAVTKNTKNESEKDDDESENNGYVYDFIKPLEQGNYSIMYNIFASKIAEYSLQQIGVCCSVGLVLLSLTAYQFVNCDMIAILHNIISIMMPVFCTVCIFYWTAVYLRKSWTSTSVYILFFGCFIGELLGQVICASIYGAPECEKDRFIMHPLLLSIMLLSTGIASMFSSLETKYSALVIFTISFVRFTLSGSMVYLSAFLRPYVAYISSIAGIILAKYMEAALKPVISTSFVQDGKIPVIKRRRSSSSTAHGFPHRSGRRTSLPALIQKNQTSVYESALVGEAHGLITDMLADSSLPPHVVSGLRAVGTLLKTDSHTPISRPKVSPLVSLTEMTNYGSDTEDLPYTGERPTSLPKRLRRSLPPNLIRRMSTSTWTTTTSATGMPTLESEPCRTRSSSFIHSRENTPSPSGSRSNSPSPANQGAKTSLHIPKSRSFSIASTGPILTYNQKRVSRDRRGQMFLPNKVSESENIIASSKENRSLSPLINPDNTRMHVSLIKPIPVKTLHNVTSDYESSDSLNSSDISDTVASQDVMSSSPKTNQIVSSEHEDLRDPDTIQAEQPMTKSEGLTAHDQVEQEVEKIHSTSPSSNIGLLPYDDKQYEHDEILHINRLNEWNYPIFKLADRTGRHILSQVAYRLFNEVGLFETFHIPYIPFMNYFHALEEGYRDKPYHNRVHATDVLHSVYYLTTQPIPGFIQVALDAEFKQHGSSSDSDTDVTERPKISHKHSFMTEDSYGIMGANLPPLELMALYTAAAMHDFDHPGRTNAFLVATHAPQAVLYNDRSVLENHHAAAAWSLFLSDPKYNFLCDLKSPVEFKRFRFLVIEAILATDLKRHFEFLAEFKAKVTVDDIVNIDWTSEDDRLMVSQMCIKLADINGPCKIKNLHYDWTMRITEEFYDQGDEEERRGLPISPYMDRNHPQLAKLQQSFINHLVAPLCNAYGQAGLLPGTWAVEDNNDTLSDNEESSETCKDTEDEGDDDTEPVKAKPQKRRKIDCLLTKNLKENHEMWVEVIKKEIQAEEEKKKLEEENAVDGEMETIKEEDLHTTVSDTKTSNNNTQTKARRKLATCTVPNHINSGQSKSVT